MEKESQTQTGDVEKIHDGPDMIFPMQQARGLRVGIRLFQVSVIHRNKKGKGIETARRGKKRPCLAEDISFVTQKGKQQSRGIYDDVA